MECELGALDAERDEKDFQTQQERSWRKPTTKSANGLFQDLREWPH